MGWVKFDDRRAMNRKLRQVGFAARGLDEAAICQSSDDGSDGVVSDATVETLAVAHRCSDWRDLVVDLVEVGRWHSAGHSCPTCTQPPEGSWVIHDYVEYNHTKGYWEAEKAKKREAGARGGKASAQARAQAPAQAPASASAEANAQAPVQANAQAVPSRIKPSTNPSGLLTRGDEELSGEEEQIRQLVLRWMTDCLKQPVGKFKIKDLVAARAAIKHLCRFLDVRVVDEQIGQIANQKTQPGSANYLLKACQRWGANSGVNVPPLILATREPPPDLAQVAS